MLKKAIKCIFILTVVMVMLASIILLGELAWARYAKKIDGAATAQVARFNFELINGIAVSQEIRNLATTRNDSNSNVDENSVTPDTHGVFEIGVDASEVDTSMVYEINIEIQNKPKNLHFYSNYTEHSGYSCQIECNDGTIRLTGYFDCLQQNKQNTQMIYWNWAYETGDTPAEIEENDEIDCASMGQTTQINMVVVGYEILNPKIKKADGEVITLTKANAASYYGAEVDYIGDGEDVDDHRTYRIFYVDFENKYRGGSGTIYLKADAGDELYSLGEYASYEIQDVSAFEKICPQWHIEDGEIDVPSDHVISYLTDSTQWTKYKNNYSQYAVGAPSIELFFDSYNMKYGTNYISRIDNKKGSVISKNGGINWWTCYANILSDEDILYSGEANYNYRLASNLGKRYGDNILHVSEPAHGVDNFYITGYMRLCPIVCLKNDFILQLK